MIIITWSAISAGMKNNDDDEEQKKKTQEEIAVVAELSVAFISCVSNQFLAGSVKQKTFLKLVKQMTNLITIPIKSVNIKKSSNDKRKVTAANVATAGAATTFNV